jgi:serine/threonine protein kinase
MLNAGDKIGPYTLTSKLGNGAFGVVWLAERRTAITTTKAALKIPLNTEVDLEAIRQEADLWVQASGHPNIMPIIEADVYDGQVVIASEYAPDGSLESWLKQYGGKSPSLEAAVDMTSGILAGLEHLHTQRIIHRDLKPANILLQRGTPRLADFGISRVLKSTNHSSIVAGTPAYMAPEAFDGARSEQTDLWAVGVILYQLLSGRLPFPHTDMASLLAGIITREPEPLPPEIPKPLQEVVINSLPKSPSERYRSAAEMRRALRTASQALEIDDTIVIEAEDPLAEIRRQMLVSNSIWQLRESLYKVDEFLSKHPQRTEALMMKYQIKEAIARERYLTSANAKIRAEYESAEKAGRPMVRSPMPIEASKSKSRSVLIKILMLVGLLGVVLYFLFKWIF